MMIDYLIHSQIDWIYKRRRYTKNTFTNIIFQNSMFQASDDVVWAGNPTVFRASSRKRRGSWGIEYLLFFA